MTCVGGGGSLWKIPCCFYPHHFFPFNPKKKFASLGPFGRRSRPMAHSPATGHHGHRGHRTCVAHTCSGSRSRPEGVVPGWWMGSWEEEFAIENDPVEIVALPS